MAKKSRAVFLTRTGWKCWLPAIPTVSTTSIFSLREYGACHGDWVTPEFPRGGRFRGNRSDGGASRDGKAWNEGQLTGLQWPVIWSEGEVRRRTRERGGCEGRAGGEGGAWREFSAREERGRTGVPVGRCGNGRESHSREICRGKKSSCAC